MLHGRNVAIGICVVLAIIGLIITAPAHIVAQEPDDTLLVTLGAVSAQGLLLTYTAIGTAADASVKAVYEADKALELMQMYEQLINTISQSLEDLSASGILSAEDKAFIDETIICYSFLNNQAQAFAKYIQTNKQEHADAFEFNRKKAWEKISKLLNIS
jgi:hypothetical protein